MICNLILLLLFCEYQLNIISLKTKRISTLSYYFPIENYDREDFINTFLSYSYIDSGNTSSSNIIVDDNKKLLPFKLYITDMKTSMNGEYFARNISLYLNNDRFSNRYERGISFGYHFIDDSFSIVHMLYHRKEIENCKFAFDNII